MCDQSSIILHFKRQKWLKFQSTLISIESMASKDTPKKLYQKRTRSTVSISRCRLCNSVADSKYSKNLFRDQNKTVLQNAQRIYGRELLHSDNLPHLICAPCERRLNNAIKFKGVIEETQRILQEEVRAKRCVDVSPTVPKPPTKVRSAGTSRRRSIDFSISTGESESSIISSPLNVSLFESNIHVLTIVNLHIYDGIFSAIIRCLKINIHERSMNGNRVEFVVTHYDVLLWLYDHISTSV